MIKKNHQIRFGKDLYLVESVMKGEYLFKNVRTNVKTWCSKSMLKNSLDKIVFENNRCENDGCIISLLENGVNTIAKINVDDKSFAKSYKLSNDFHNDFKYFNEITPQKLESTGYIEVKLNGPIKKPIIENFDKPITSTRPNRILSFWRNDFRKRLSEGYVEVTNDDGDIEYVFENPSPNEVRRMINGVVNRNTTYRVIITEDGNMAIWEADSPILHEHYIDAKENQGIELLNPIHLFWYDGKLSFFDYEPDKSTFFDGEKENFLKWARMVDNNPATRKYFPTTHMEQDMKRLFGIVDESNILDKYVSKDNVVSETKQRICEAKSFHSYCGNIYYTTVESEVNTIIENKFQKIPVRILYDFTEHLYILANGFDFIHRDLILGMFENTKYYQFLSKFYENNDEWDRQVGKYIKDNCALWQIVPTTRLGKYNGQADGYLHCDISTFGERFAICRSSQRDNCERVPLLKDCEWWDSLYFPEHLEKLDEEIVYANNVKSLDGENDLFAIEKNPSKKEFWQSLKNSKYKQIRGLVGCYRNSNIYIWDASFGTHNDVYEKYLKGKDEDLDKGFVQMMFRPKDYDCFGFTFSNWATKFGYNAEDNATDRIPDKMQQIFDDDPLGLLNETVSDRPISQEDREAFLKIVRRHNKYVNQFASKVGKSFPNHDQDKFSDDILIPYVKGFIWDEHDMTRDEVNQFHNAQKTHYKNNAHHPEHWYDPNTSNDCSKMSDDAIIEMCADWCAMSYVFGNSPIDWANDHIGSRWKFNDRQTKLIYDTLNKMWSE